MNKTFERKQTSTGRWILVIHMSGSRRSGHTRHIADHIWMASIVGFCVTMMNLLRNCEKTPGIHSVHCLSVIQFVELLSLHVSSLTQERF